MWQAGDVVKERWRGPAANFLVVLEGFFSLSRRGCLHVGFFDRIRVNSSRRMDAYMNIFLRNFAGLCRREEGRGV